MLPLLLGVGALVVIIAVGLVVHARSARSAEEE